LHRFTPPPEGEDYDDDYSDEEGEYTDEEGEYSDEDEDEEGGVPGKAPYKDELLQMVSAFVSCVIFIHNIILDFRKDFNHFCLLLIQYSCCLLLLNNNFI
jgi:hypothetical protein